MCELGNLSIHLALRDLRPPGTKVRKIPFPTGNPFTALFDLVSCPNYTYEIGSWAAFTVMTQCVPGASDHVENVGNPHPRNVVLTYLAAGLFTIAGGYQMTVWALGKHRNYKKEFPNYPKKRRAIFPFVL